VSARTGKARSLIRPFEPRDIPAIEMILSESPEAAAWSKESLEQLTARNWLAWVVECDANLAGFLVTRIIADDEAEILNLAVARSSRRAGVGTNLLRAAIGELAGRRVRKLHLEVRESNTAGIALYEESGFLRAGRRPNYYRNPNEAAVLLVKELTG
jgi:[ribosomal protein S18]-alanine N-acetyltransferase